MLRLCLDEVYRPRGGDTEQLVPREVLQDAAVAVGLFHDGLPLMASLREELEEALDRRLAEMRADIAETAPREGTVKWYFKHRDQPLSQHSTMTIWQYCYGIMWHKLYANTVGKGVDLMCAWLSSGGVLPPNNFAPRYMLIEIYCHNTCIDLTGSPHHQYLCRSVLQVRVHLQGRPWPRAHRHIRSGHVQEWTVPTCIREATSADPAARSGG